MKKHNKGSGSKAIISWLLSLLMIAAGVLLIGYFFFGKSLTDPATNGSDPGGFNVPKIDNSKQSSVSGPKDKTLKLTIPKMNRIKDDKVPNAPGTDGDALDSNAAIHLEGTGYPWEKNANVYIAGHRLGYPSTGSFLSFFDLSKLQDGDEVFVTDANGTKYTYKVFREFAVSPSNLSVTKPVEGKSVITLQTCTLPDYSERLIVQAELVDKTKKAA